MKSVKKYELYMEQIAVWEEETEYITKPSAVVDFLNRRLKFDRADREKFIVLALDTKNEIIGVHEASIGTLDSSYANPMEIMKFALLANARALIVSHNHPSGKVQPSRADIETTARLKKAGELMNIPVLDHIIVGHDSYYSFKEQGVM